MWTMGMNWEKAQAYRYVEGLDRTGVAWELLRRNRQYQMEVARHIVVVEADGGLTRILTPPDRNLLDLWGLSFRYSG